MSDPGDRSGDIYNAGEGDVADFDDGNFGGTTDIDTGHHTVHGQVDGDHYQRSWESDGSEDHSTLGSGDLGSWHVDHE